jgi:hypothetical protein
VQSYSMSPSIHHHFPPLNKGRAAGIVGGWRRRIARADPFDWLLGAGVMVISAGAGLFSLFINHCPHQLNSA